MSSSSFESFPVLKKVTRVMMTHYIISIHALTYYNISDDTTAFSALRDPRRGTGVPVSSGLCKLHRTVRIVVHVTFRVGVIPVVGVGRI